MWQEYLKRFPKTNRYTLGEKVDSLFVEVLEAMVTASILTKEKKIPHLLMASIKLDVLKFFLQIAWEVRALQTKHYSIISEYLNEVGRMLGGWKRGIESKTPAQ